MASLRQLATQVIDALDQPFNELLYQRSKDLIVHERALDYRRSVQRHGIDHEFKQRYKVPVERVDKSDFYGVQTDMQVFRSSNRIAKLIRFQNDNPFTFVGPVSHTKPFTFTEPYAVELLDTLRYMKYLVKYTYNNGYIYIFNHVNTLANIAVESIFADPRELDYSTSDAAAVPFTDDMEFFISEDLISNIKLRIFSGDLKITLTDDEETNIVEDEVNR